MTESGKFRVDVQGVNETIWVSNAMRWETKTEAEVYARDLFARWMGMQAWRVVPESTPERETVAPKCVVCYDNGCEFCPAVTS